MKDYLIDEIILNIEPVVLGEGTYLFSEENFNARLQLVEQKQIGNGILQVRYTVERPSVQ
jgi:riboflavin biosynthesis pyrimidine reductase